MTRRKVKLRRIKIQKAIVRKTTKNSAAYFNQRRLLNELYRNYYSLNRYYEGPFRAEFARLTKVAMSENAYYEATKKEIN